MPVITRTPEEVKELVMKVESSVPLPTSKLHLYEVNGAIILSASPDPFEQNKKPIQNEKQ